MTKVMKRVWAYALVLVMIMTGVLGAASQDAYAAEEVKYRDGKHYTLLTEGDWQYIVINDEVITMRYTGTAASVNVPSQIAGKPVVEIGRNENYPYTGTFMGNNSMQTVTVPSSVKCIGSNAFRDCSGLQQVLISDSVTDICSAAFSGCAYLQRVQIKGSGLKTIHDEAFRGCAALDNFKIPESVETIGTHAFMDCTSLSAIVIPDSVTSLGGGAFAGCTSMVDAVIGANVPALPISSSASWNDSTGIEGSKNGCFERCYSLRTVTFGKSVESIGDDAFAGTALLEVVLPDTVKAVGRAAFYDCNALKKVVIGDGVKKIGDRAFDYCEKIETVSIGKRVKEIGALAFRGNTGLKEIVIPSNVKSLGAGAFAHCYAMETAVIGHGVERLTDISAAWDEKTGNGEKGKLGAFENCTSLKSVTLGDGLLEVGVDAFAGTALVSVSVPDNVVTIGTAAFANCKQLQRIHIGDGVTSIGGYTFANDSALIDVTIGRGVTEIGDSAFRYCTSLEALQIPSNVTAVGNALCYYCSSLKTVILGNGVTKLDCKSGPWDENGGAERGKEGAFERCAALENVSLGSGLTTIGADTFCGSKIKSLLIPAKVSSIANGTFYGINYENLYFAGNAPTLGAKLFNWNAPKMYRMPGKIGYDEITNYTFEEFTPIKVVFDLNDNDVFAIPPTDQYMTPQGGYVIEPIAPVAEGYRFLGWYKDSACQTAWDFLANKVTENTTIYASWAKIEDVVPAQPAGVEDKDATATAVEIYWSPSEGATGYRVYVDGKEVTTSAVAACEYRITGLEFDTAYEVEVAAENANGQSPKSLIKVVWTSDEPYVLGDVNEDGFINAADALAILNKAAGISDLTAVQAMAGDVEADGVINASDALKVLQYAAGIIKDFN